MTGYQEVLTDPSYRGQIVAMTYPLIGNYGTNALDQESREPHVRGFVIEELSEIPSNWRSETSLEDYLRHWKIPGVQGIDTRALTRHLRERGAMKACLTSEALSDKEAVAQAVAGQGVIGMDYVREVTTPRPTSGIRTTGSAPPGRWRVERTKIETFRPFDIASWPTTTGSRRTFCAASARTVSASPSCQPPPPRMKSCL